MTNEECRVAAKAAVEFLARCPLRGEEAMTFVVVHQMLSRIADGEALLYYLTPDKATHSSDVPLQPGIAQHESTPPPASPPSDF